MDYKKLIGDTPSQGLEPRQYIDNLWTACNNEDHFFAYLMQTMHFLSHEFPILPVDLYTGAVTEAINFTEPRAGEFYASYMATMPDNPFGVCFGIRKTKSGNIEFSWFNIAREGGKIYAFNPCRLKSDTEDSVSYLGIQIPTLMITEQFYSCRTYWDMLERYIKQYENLLPFITPEQAQKMAEEERKREAKNLQTIMHTVADFINALPINERDSALNAWNTAQT